MKHEWRKKEKGLYLPPKKPVLVDIPKYKYYTITGKGNPNSSVFVKCIEALYAVSYTIRMSYKKGIEPDNFYEYTVYPLEGFWDISDEVKNEFDGVINKDEFIFTIMIRQPEFVDQEYAAKAIEWALEKKSIPYLENLEFKELTENKCVQMMHIGSYDTEAESFQIMENFCAENNLIRKSKQHKEIYISDPRKVAPEKLKTVLRFEVE